jgi:hypothetical protein
MNCSVRFSWNALSIVRTFCRLQRVVVAADACQRRHLLWQHCIRGTLLGNVVWRDARRCWKWLSRFGVPASCRPSIAPPVRGGAAVVCANIHCDVLLLIVVVWRAARRCHTMSTRSGARCSVDHRCRRPCTVAPPFVCAKVAYDVPVLAVVMWRDAAQMSDNVDSSSANVAYDAVD